jgi:outer membrane protein, adhesin transport system
MINRGDFMQFIQKRALFLLLGLLGLMAVGSVQAALPEPVRQAILEAVNTNPEVQERWHAFLAAEEGQGVARGGYYPEVDLRLSAARQWQDSNEFGRVDRDPSARHSLSTRCSTTVSSPAAR